MSHPSLQDNQLLNDNASVSSLSMKQLDGKAGYRMLAYIQSK